MLLCCGSSNTEKRNFRRGLGLACRRFESGGRVSITAHLFVCPRRKAVCRESEKVCLFFAAGKFVFKALFCFFSDNFLLLDYSVDFIFLAYACGGVSFSFWELWDLSPMYACDGASCSGQWDPSAMDDGIFPSDLFHSILSWCLC